MENWLLVGAENHPRCLKFFCHWKHDSKHDLKLPAEGIKRLIQSFVKSWIFFTVVSSKLIH